MQPAPAALRRPMRPGRRKNTSLLKQVFRRCFPYRFPHVALRFEGSPALHFDICVLLVLLVPLLTLLFFLCFHLLVRENETLTKYLHLTNSLIPKTVDEEKVLPLQSASPKEIKAVKESLRPFVPRTAGVVPRRRENGFLSTYFDLEERVLPPLTKSALEAWFADDALRADVAENVLLQHAWDNKSTITTTHEKKNDDEFFNLLAFLYPTSQQQSYYRAALNDILGFGARVGGTKREPLLRHLLSEGLGIAHYNAEQHRYLSVPHLSQKGVELLEKTESVWPSAPNFIPSAAAAGDNKRKTNNEADRIAGWRWSLVWDNFSTTIPIAVEGQSSPSVNLQNLVFQFPGGSQFRRKKAALARPQDVFVGSRANPQADLVDYRKRMFPQESRLPNAFDDMYVQESYMGPGVHPVAGLYFPGVQRGKPGDKVEINTRGKPVPLKPLLAFPVAELVSRQPIQHAVYAAHWDSMRSSEFRFLGACDSAIPMVYLLRTIKNIAILTDVAEALTELYKEERVGPDNVLPDGAVVPGLTTTFRKSATEEEVRVRLAKLLSPAHHALLTQYFFARPYAVGTRDLDADADTTLLNYAQELEVDVRRWLDWVQHLPALSIVFFDAEEAFEKWANDDHTYGSRHLAQRWRELTTTTQTRYSGGPQSLFDAVDLFALYDIMGTAGTTFHNFHPTQSGIYYGALSQKEKEMRQRAFRDTSTITAELLWRVVGTNGKGEEAGTPTSKDNYVRQLGSSVDVAMAALAKQHVANVLAIPSSRPSLATLPRPWLLYGTPHEMLTLHRKSLSHSFTGLGGVGNLASARQYDDPEPSLVKHRDFNPYNFLRTTNRNIFFPQEHATLLRRRMTDPMMEDDHIHWLDTQRVLHLISVPFPDSWHKESDDGRDIHDGTTVDLANVLWSTVLELGHYWTGEEDVV